MPRIIGVDIPENKPLKISLTYIYGMGTFLAKEVIDKLGFNPDMRARELSQDDIARLNRVLQDEYVLEGDKRRDVQNNIRRLISINCYRGVRHKKGLPVRGQRTSTNARTRKGKKKTVANKKK